MSFVEVVVRFENEMYKFVIKSSDHLSKLKEAFLLRVMGNNQSINTKGIFFHGKTIVKDCDTCKKIGIRNNDEIVYIL